ncbi:helix-turn-helix domain-containing protein [Bosea sp. LjRoot90]|uniref:helix-turn-helix domain-containing protein n=1 Tax=Bosea sp. LjRoot90 TaxID=3342342 RepID=UPI003ECD6837
MLNEPNQSRSNGQRLRELRKQLSITQDKLAIMSGVNIRTIQRAERGVVLQLDTLAGIAAALRVTVGDILEANAILDNGSDPKEERNAVALRHISSGKALLDIILGSFSGTLYCNAEPTAHNIDSLSGMVEQLENLIPNPWTTPMEDIRLSLAQRLRLAVNISEEISNLERLGIAIYAGTYTASAQIPNFDMDTGEMYVSGRQRPQPVTVCRIVVDRVGLSRVVVKVQDEWEEPTPAHAMGNSGASDDIPF